LPCDVGTQGIRGTEAGTLANQDNDELCAERGTYLIADGDAALLDEANGGRKCQ
jgi:hypothetical protein